MRRLLLIATLVVVSSGCSSPLPRLAALQVPAQDIGDDWVGPRTDLAVDNVDSPPQVPEQSVRYVDGLCRHMKAIGAVACSDFTYSRKSNPKKRVSLILFIFKTEKQCERWFASALLRDKRTKPRGTDYSAFDSSEMNLRVAYIGKVGMSGGPNYETDDHLGIINLYMIRAKNLTARGAEQDKD